MLKVQHLGKQYDNGWALQPLDLELKRGLHGLLGPNGAGKSTLMRLLAGLLPATSGDAYLNGSSVRDFRRTSRAIGYLPQIVRVHPQLTARQWLTHAAALHGVKGKTARAETVQRILEEVNLAEEADWPSRAYSFGMIKRLCIAQALLSGSELLIVDEPTAGLDPEERLRLRSLLADAAATRIVLLSTHVLGDIQASCKNVLVLAGGRLLYHGELAGLTRFAQDRTWTWEASESEWRRMPLRGLLSARSTPDGIVCRALADKRPTPFAEPAFPTVEEGYLALISSGGRML
ncbi:ATP-binding cassette domain-containing protein [Paenibacillus beijingensis]|uniref:ABC transporter domain-containing protein n=1 Tax=Paenibacillus beijingensis TaxID=1126833 RepID=A0A0D5NFD9_9BACL|nr:ATP-binding cassette domain-containing protein [Paenibacillus beijingensis]AJY73677.1 hypothetical protein VN24_02315 [Paenibacillus beijingensis]